MANFLLLAIVGLIAQLVDGSLGMAYGVTSQSLLLTVGIAPALASASVHIAEVGTTAASGASRWRWGMGANLHADVALFRTYGAAQDHRHRRYQRVPRRPKREHRLSPRPQPRGDPVDRRRGTPARRRHSRPDSRLYRAHPASPHPRDRRRWHHPDHEHEDVPGGRGHQWRARYPDLLRDRGRLDRRPRILDPGQSSGGSRRRR